jgi:transposase-like protein
LSKNRRTAAFKKKVALDALREEKTLGQLASEHGVHPIQVSKWKKELIDGCETIFQDKRERQKAEPWDREALERKIGQLTIELDYLKKKLGY